MPYTKLFRNILGILLGAVTLFGQSSTNCLHLTHATGKYSISYPQQECPHKDFPPISSELFEALSNWTFNTGYKKLISPLVQFRIYARLASLDTKHDHGFAFGPCAIGPWSEYGWAEHADFAFLTVKEDLPTHPELSVYFASEAKRLGLARRDDNSGISFKRSRLSSSKKKRLINLFQEIESRLSKEPDATKALVTFETHLKANPGHSNTLSVFGLSE